MMRERKRDRGADEVLPAEDMAFTLIGMPLYRVYRTAKTLAIPSLYLAVTKEEMVTEICDRLMDINFYSVSKIGEVLEALGVETGGLESRDDMITALHVFLGVPSSPPEDPVPIPGEPTQNTENIVDVIRQAAATAPRKPPTPPAPQPSTGDIIEPPRKVPRPDQGSTPRPPGVGDNTLDAIRQAAKKHDEGTAVCESCGKDALRMKYCGVTGKLH
eukprot:Sspe_Gene.29140::Locus_13670_Transcript_1_1_Confidence_1.000_Length_1022::g.29140::m.29140